MGQGDWQRALAAAGEITEAWLTDEDADLSHHIDAAIEKDGHDILYAMARLAGNLKREIRDRILQQTLAADFPPHDEKIEAFG